MSAPANVKYLESHEWIETGAEIARVGVSDHAQAELTDVVYVELPQVGRVVFAKDSVAVVESVKAASDIYSPVGGEIVEVNEALTNEPGLINQDAFGKGWIFKIKLSNPAELDALVSAEDYAKRIGK